MTNILEVEDLTKIFVIGKDADLIAVNNVSFSLKRGGGALKTTRYGAR